MRHQGTDTDAGSQALGLPCMILQRRLQRRVRDIAGIVRDSRGGDGGDHLEQEILAKRAARKRSTS